MVRRFLRQDIATLPSDPVRLLVLMDIQDPTIATTMHLIGLTIQRRTARKILAPKIKVMVNETSVNPDRSWPGKCCLSGIAISCMIQVWVFVGSVIRFWCSGINDRLSAARPYL